MRFDERKEIAHDALAVFLDEYSTPPRVSDQGLAKKMVWIADTLARRLPTDGVFSEELDKVFDRVRIAHDGGSWPPLPVFMDCMPFNQAKLPKAPETFSESRIKNAERAVNNGAPVPEDMLFSALNCDPDKLFGYRQACVENYKFVYREDARRQLVKSCGDVAGSFFDQVTT